jgi:hypothetical protein
MWGKYTMKALTTLSIGMLLLLAGCSSPKFYWYHPDRSLEEAKADFSECQDQARQKATDMISDQHYDRLPPPGGTTAARDVRKQSEKPSDPQETQDAWQGRYEQSVITDGMKDKGYIMLRSNRLPHGVHTKKFPQGAVAGQ